MEDIEEIADDKMIFEERQRRDCGKHMDMDALERMEEAERRQGPPNLLDELRLIGAL